MGRRDVLEHTRVGWWAGTEPGNPLAALSGSLLRAEMRARCPGLAPVLVYSAPPFWGEPGFTGEPAAFGSTNRGGGDHTYGIDAHGIDIHGIDIFVASGSPEGGARETAQTLTEAGTPTVAVAPEEGWGLEPHRSVGSPFAVPEPLLLAPRHLPRRLLEARAAYLRVVEGLPERYVLVEQSVLSSGDTAIPADLELALTRLAEGAGGGGGPAEVVWLSPGPLGDDPKVEAALRQRRAEAEEGRYQPEDWPGYPWRPHPELRVTNPVDVAAAVAAAGVVVAHTGAMMSLAWALGVPHVALGTEESPPSAFAAWTGDASALAADPGEIVATIPNIFARTGRPPGSKRLEATLDQSLDDSAEILKKTAADVSATRHERPGLRPWPGGPARGAPGCQRSSPPAAGR